MGFCSSLGSNPLRVGRRDRSESSRVLVHFGGPILSLPGLTPGPSCCPPSYVEVLSLPMDSEWYSRFIDERPGLCFLSVYCWALRLLSGLSQVGCLWARGAALAHGIVRGFRAAELSEAPVRAFLDFMCDVSSRELPRWFLRWSVNTCSLTRLTGAFFELPRWTLGLVLLKLFARRFNSVLPFQVLVVGLRHLLRPPDLFRLRMISQLSRLCLALRVRCFPAPSQVCRLAGVETSFPPVLPPLCPLAGLTPAVDGVSGYSTLGLSDHYAKPWPCGLRCLWFY